MKHLIKLNAMAFIAAMCSLSLVACDDDDDAPDNDLNMYKGHEYVDLGLSVKWATCNEGAENPEDYGSYYAWGETKTKSEYNWDTYTVEQESFVGDNKTVLDPEDDAATANWGGKWRMLTAADREELYNNTIQTWTNDYEGTGVKGYILASKKAGYEGASIFLPAAGLRSDGDLNGEGFCGFYWSSSLVENVSSYARNLKFYPGDYFYLRFSSYRYDGFPVRPVCKPQ